MLCISPTSTVRMPQQRYEKSFAVMPIAETARQQVGYVPVKLLQSISGRRVHIVNILHSVHITRNRLNECSFAVYFMYCGAHSFCGMSQLTLMTLYGVSMDLVWCLN